MSDYPDAYVHAVVKARKTHRCYECRGDIKAGEQYHRHSGIWEGEPGRFKVCADCEALRSEVDADNEGGAEDQVYFGELLEHILESWDAKRLRRFVTNADNRSAIVQPSTRRRLMELEGGELD